ncbi:MAG: hypothetical protein BWY23_01976 [Spirochaetes bacterium ADurb.Bin218]|jgi:hypothetical protein|nr:hypothetical protein [Spirochaetota bacterium]OQA96508.1 MAG: hypothetical protein BWY23_01976 [Spirochaetes bacterium ADurb.Bin218]HOQ10892.1 hypothetical protein [Spirochaetota bacterium]HOV08722.1 hypothetical protein [Spirochaetota bacterium]HPX91287.1 hypothetical protein [Spirochaetota bacterium]
MKRALFVLLSMVFAFASISYSQETGTKEQLKKKTELKSQDSNKGGAKEQIRTQEQNRVATETKEKAMEKNQIQTRLKDDQKTPAVDGQKEQNAVKNSGDEKKLQERNREKNREKKQDKKELKKELKEQKKEMRENKKILQDMNKGGKGANN